MINISFFSYKGGAGRTSLLYNVLPFLAEKIGATEMEPIIVLDLDIDSKGLSFLIEEDSGVNSIQVLKGDKAIGYRHTGSIREHPFFKQLCPIGDKVGLSGDKARSILFVSANSKEGITFLGDTNNFDGRYISLNALNRLCYNYHCKAIVMDTPAGNQLASECALSISNKIVTTMRITKQFRRGTQEFLREASSRFENKEFIIVPNAVPDAIDDVYDIEKIIMDIAGNSKKSIECNSRNIVNLKMVEDGRMGIKEVNLFKLVEENLKKESRLRKLLKDEEMAVQMYELLAEELINEKL